jgi:hypothetical protein
MAKLSLYINWTIRNKKCVTIYPHVHIQLQHILIKVFLEQDTFSIPIHHNGKHRVTTKT